VSATDDSMDTLLAGELDSVANGVDDTAVRTAHDHNEPLARPNDQSLLVLERVSAHPCTGLHGEGGRNGLEVGRALDRTGGQYPWEQFLGSPIEMKNRASARQLIAPEANANLPRPGAASARVLVGKDVGMRHDLARSEGRQEEGKRSGVVVVTVAEHKHARWSEVDAESGGVTQEYA
jgi:hypothetical protein